jgi:hypothetical protein
MDKEVDIELKYPAAPRSRRALAATVYSGNSGIAPRLLLAPGFRLLAPFPRSAEHAP